MKDELTKLINLSKLDAEINAFVEKKDQLPQDVQGLKKQLEELSQNVENKKRELSSLKAQQKQKEMDLAEQKEWVEKREGRLKEIKTNKEYHASVKEITQAKRIIAQLEEGILKLIGEAEEQDKKLQEAEKALEDQRSSIEQHLREKVSEAEGIQSQIDEVVKKRNGEAKQIDGSLVKMYQTIRSRVSPPLAQAQNGTCLECNTRIPPQFYIEIQKFKQVVSCPRCHRILYIV